MLKINPDTPLDPDVLAVLAHVQAAAGALGTGLKLVEPDNQISAAEELLQAFLAGFQKSE